MAAVEQQPKPNASKINSSMAMWIGILASLAFTGFIWLIDPYMPQIDFLPDQGASWYLWKLPEPTFWSQFTAWTGYFLHQITIWYLIFYGQKTKLKYSKGLHPLNVAMFAANAAFILLHILQTRIWYDGLAQNVSIWTSQGSVVLMLVLILLMENQRRGLFFGKKVKMNWFKESGRFVRRYHGYIFVWAIIYTFWYHPIEGTSGHLLGLLYTFLLLVQGSLLFTRAHLNRWWTVTLEVFVLIHGTLVAIMTANGAWPMFFFGFATIFVVTQMYGLGLKLWQKWAFIVAYIAAVVVVYWSRGWANLAEIPRIPVIEYALVFLLALMIWGGMWLVNRLRRSRQERKHQLGTAH